MSIAIISDTHCLLRPEVEEILRSCDMILHGGDIASQEIYEKIGDVAPAHFVRGNADKEWAEDIPKDLDIELGGYHFYMVHNIKHARKDLSGVDKLIKSIIKDMDANRTVDQISERNRIDRDLVEEILQIYTTHPGIDIDGILDRMK